ncbi:MAG: hypothetical protein IJP61_10230 [Treponema sp.]|nr:hypothetical protein [Treponema sp.]
MKSQLKIIVPVFICFISLFLFNMFRTIPESHHWKDYLLVYVSSEELTEDSVVSVLKKNGAKNIISKSTLTIPKISEFAPIQAQPHDSYLFARENFFYDENKSMMVFYVPSIFSSAAQKSVREISAFKDTIAGTDGTPSFPWFYPAVTLAFSLLCVFFTDKPLYFVALAFIHIFFAFTRPLASVAASCCMSLTGFIFILKICDRKEFLGTLKKSMMIFVFIFLPFVLLVAVSPLSSLFYLLCVTAAMSIIFLFRTISEIKFTKNMFNLVFIRNARMIPIFEKKSMKLMLALFSSVLLILAHSLFSSSLSYTKKDSRPALPSPVKFGGNGVLPTFKDFTDWYWNTVVFPYRHLDMDFDVPEEGETVYIIDYSDENGKIKETKSPVYTFNEDFRNSVENYILNQKEDSFEKILLSQGSGTKFAFSKSSGIVKERFGKSVLIVFMLLPLVFAGYYIHLGKKYGFSV